MSSHSTVVLLYNADTREEAEMAARLEAAGIVPLANLSDPGSEVSDWWSGQGFPTLGVYGAVYNYLDLNGLLDALKGASWRHPERLTLVTDDRRAADHGHALLRLRDGTWWDTLRGEPCPERYPSIEDLEREYVEQMRAHLALTAAG